MKTKIYVEDISASIVVFLVALPLCLGIALASGAPPVSGIIAGIVGGLIVGIISNSAVGVSGPAAGLVAICVSAVKDLGSFEAFLVSVILAGIFQIVFGILKGGKLSYFFPSSVITGMLTAIGIIIILKQIPHAFGYDKDFEGDLAFKQPDNQNTFSEIINVLNYLHFPSVVIFLFGVILHILWEKIVSARFYRFSRIVQAPLVIVLSGILLIKLFQIIDINSIQTEHLVNIPRVNEMISNYSLPDWDFIFNNGVWYYGFIIFFVASIETLLCVEATDNLDHQKRITNRNRELIAQGFGNLLSGVLGGLPVTQVIVRSSANIDFGAKTKMSAVLHGIWLLLSVIFIRDIINLIPLSALATVLIIVGYNLAKPERFKVMYKKGWKDFYPFIITIIAILFTDLLIGTLTGLLSAIVIQFYISSMNAIKVNKKKDSEWIIEIDDSASFMNKSKLSALFNNIKENESVEIIYNGNDSDIIELIKYQQTYLQSKNILCYLKIQSITKNYMYENTDH